jgi:hypothetical protein
MEHLIVREAISAQEREQAISWAQNTLDGDLLDADIFAHKDTFLLSALLPKGTQNLGPDGLMRRMAYLPVQQPLMLENLIFAPGLSDWARAVAMTRMAEAAISEAYRRDVGELYFLCREPSTCAFAERHKFVRIDGEDSELKLTVYRLNLRETFGV